MTATPPPRCGRPKVKAKYGNVLCLAARVKLADGNYGPACARHLTPAEKTAHQRKGTGR